MSLDKRVDDFLIGELYKNEDVFIITPNHDYYKSLFQKKQGKIWEFCGCIILYAYSGGLSGGWSGCDRNNIEKRICFSIWWKSECWDKWWDPSVYPKGKK